MLAAVAAFAGMDAVLKLFAGHYPPIQVTALRGAASLPFLLAVLAWNRSWGELRTRRPGLHLLRGLLAIVMMWGFVYAVSELTLASAYAIFFVSPLLVTALSVPLLGEHVEGRRWVTIGVGLMAVIWMLDPGPGLFGRLGSLGALLAAAAYAISAVTVRILTRTDSTTAMVFWFLALMTLFAGVLALPGWVPLRPEHWSWLALLGFLGALGQQFITEAFRLAPASVVAPFEYTALVWVVALDFVFWDALPGARVLSGAAVVICCGLYLIQLERQLHLELAARAEGPGTAR
jgi:drug/metabolite transporter (DMT)-like permease